jgi:hypothetical protein
MIRELTGAAHALDHWLKINLGRPYTAILTAGLVLSIIATVRGLQQSLGSTGGAVTIAATVAFQFGLLINQLSQFHEYREARRSRREARRRAREDAGPEPPASAG